MKREYKDTQDLCQRLQSDVDAILAEVGRYFDDIKEYAAQDGDPLHQLDIDTVLSYEFKPKKEQIAAPAYSFPANDTPSSRKVMRAMPQNMQEDVRIYEYKNSPRSSGIIGKSLKFLLKRLEY